MQFVIQDIIGLSTDLPANDANGSTAVRRLVASTPMVVIVIKQRTAEEAMQTASDIDDLWTCNQQTTGFDLFIYFISILIFKVYAL